MIEYDPEWPRTFYKLKDQIWPRVCDVAIAIEHVGSTSVPGVAAKPVIDIDIVIASRNDLRAVVERLETLGYKHRGNLGIEDRDAFRALESGPEHHLYVCVQNCLALRNHLAVRDYLRANPSEAAAYSNLKRKLAEEFRDHRERYQQEKTRFVLSILERCGFPTGELSAIQLANQQ